MAMVAKKNLPAIASRNLFIIRSRKTSPKILFDYLQSETVGMVFRKQLEDLAGGAPIRHINLKAIKEIPVPLLYSDKHLTRLADVKQIDNLKDLIKTRNEIVHLRRAYEEYSAKEGRNDYAAN